MPPPPNTTSVRRRTIALPILHSVLEDDIWIPSNEFDTLYILTLADESDLEKMRVRVHLA